MPFLSGVTVTSGAASSLEERLAAVRRAPHGPAVTAYVDLDGTLVDGYTAASFYRHRLFAGEVGPGELLATVAHGLRGVRAEEDFAAFLATATRALAGRSASELDELGRRLFRDDTSSGLRPELWALLAEHRRRGHRIVLASSATRFQVAPMAEAVDADAALCTRLEEDDGVLTGRVEGPALWGVAKAASVAVDAEGHGVDLGVSFGYADGDEDVPLLETVGVPTAVSPGPGLRATAESRGWPVLDAASRGGLLPDLGDVARMLGLYGGMSAAFGVSLGVALLRGSRERVRDITSSVGADVGLALAGIDVEVGGAEHLWSSRPCVFVFNHQSKLDAVILMKLLRGGFTGVAKKEAANIPGWGQFFRLADVAFVDRGDHERARDALAPAVARLRDDGVSLVLAPEGTRSATPRLGPFKKGAFHIAVQAGVPMVPIVIRNAGEVMWRGAQTMRSGTVDVRVLPAVDTSLWAEETVDDHVDEVRDMFVRTLADWPAGTGTRG
jgi:putative phosphoserine phosphatase / 1-acylglycerol-3-phosphate O-acyltransferase